MTNTQESKAEEQARIEFGYWKKISKSPYNAPINDHYLITPDDMFSIEMRSQPDDAEKVVNVGEMNQYRVINVAHTKANIHLRTYVKEVATKRYDNEYGTEKPHGNIKEDILAVYRDGGFAGFAFSHVDEWGDYSCPVDFDIKHFYGYYYAEDGEPFKNILMYEEYAIHEMTQYIKEQSLIDVSEKNVDIEDALKFVMKEVKNK